MTLRRITIGGLALSLNGRRCGGSTRSTKRLMTSGGWSLLEAEERQPRAAGDRAARAGPPGAGQLDVAGVGGGEAAAGVPAAAVLVARGQARRGGVGPDLAPLAD